MLDRESREKLKNKLRGSLQKASSKVTTEVKAERGDFRITLSSKDIDHYYKEQKVASIKVADLDDELVEFIQNDPEEVCAMMLTEFVDGFEKEAFEKTAAHATQDGNTYKRITEKQMDNQKVPLHPRDEEGQPYRNITEKQMPQHDERHGSYNVITQGQLRDTKTTFKGEPMDASKRMGEDRTIITEGQFDEEEQQGSVDRGDMGSVFNKDQSHMVEEKQFTELLSHHGWEEPRTITEGKDQLGEQRGELGRLTAEAASKMMKEAINALGKTVFALGVTPEEVRDVLKSLTSHQTKEPALASILNPGQDVSDISKQIQRRQYHKTASTNSDEKMIASAVIRQLANMDGDPRHKAALIFSVASSDNWEKTQKKMADIFSDLQEGKIKEEMKSDPDDVKSVFAAALDDKNKLHLEGSDSDGLYQYAGTTKEVDQDPNDRDKFAEKAFKHCKVIVAENSNAKEDDLVPVSIDVDQEKGTFEITMKDASKVDQKQVEARAERRREMAKEAQVPAGGVAPTGSPEMGQTAPPPGGADMGAPPPVESLGGEAPGMGEEEGPAGGEPKPPGSVCPVCGSEDVDVDNGEFRCNGCGGEGSLFVEFEITKWPGTIEESEEEGAEEEGFELGGEEEAAGLESEVGLTPPNVPIAASVRIKPATLEKLAAQKIKLGSVCPNCGCNNCDIVAGQGICYDCNTEYKITLSTQKKQPYKLAARFEWTPAESNGEECKGCNRLKLAFRKALSDYGMTFAEFHALDPWKAKGEVVMKMAKAGVLADVQKQLRQNLPLEKIAGALPARWKGYGEFDRFPIDSCTERLNRRFGENASAISGPCEGKKLAECVCSQLNSLGVYTDGLAAKVANVHMSNDPEEQFPTEECIKTMGNEGFRLKESGMICDCLKAAYASYEDLLIEAITNYEVKTGGVAVAPKPMTMPMAAKPMPEDDMAIEEDVGDVAIDDVGEEAPEELDIIEEDAETPDVTIDEAIGEEDMGEPVGAGEEIEEIGEDIGGGETVDITLTLDKDTAEDIYQAIDDAINQGSIGEEGLGDEGIGIGEDVGIEEEAVEVPGETGEEESVIDEEVTEEVPGTLDNAEELAPGDLAKEGDEAEPCAMKPAEMPGEGGGKEEAIAEIEEGLAKLKGTPEAAEAKPVPAPASAPEAKPAENKEEKPAEEKPAEEKEEPKEKSDEEKEASALDEMLMKMKQGTITKESAGVSSLIDSLIKQAQEEPEKFKYLSEQSKKTKEEPAQDSVEFKIKDGGKIGHEDAFTADKPDVPRKKQLLGTEGKDMGVSDTGDMPSIPAGSAAMKGEQHYRPEKQEEVDPNQGGESTTASSEKEITKEGDMKETKYKVASSHKLFAGLKKLYASGKKEIKCSDGMEYDVGVSTDKKAFVLTAKKSLPEALKQHQFKKKDAKEEEPENSEKSEEKKEKKGKEARSKKTVKQSQTKQVKHIRTNEDDPDINQTSGPGKGKVKDTQNMGEEPAPDEGVSKPDVPKAPNQGRLNREETVTNALEMPKIPAGGGQDPVYDQNTKNTPEKQEDVLGLERPLMASNNADIRKEATRIAGEMLKQSKITSEQLNDQIEHLSQLTMPLLKQYEEDLLKKSDTNKDAGLDKTASVEAVETAFVIPASTPIKGKEEGLVDQIQSLMTLSSRNDEYEKLKNEQGNMDAFRQ